MLRTGRSLKELDMRTWTNINIARTDVLLAGPVSGAVSQP